MCLDHGVHPTSHSLTAFRSLGTAIVAVARVTGSLRKCARSAGATSRQFGCAEDLISSTVGRGVRERECFGEIRAVNTVVAVKQRLRKSRASSGSTLISVKWIWLLSGGVLSGMDHTAAPQVGGASSMSAVWDEMHSVR